MTKLHFCLHLYFTTCFLINCIWAQDLETGLNENSDTISAACVNTKTTKAVSNIPPFVCKFYNLEHKSESKL